MKITGNIPLTGELKIFKNGRLVVQHHNLVVESGATWVAERMAGSTSPAPTDMNRMGIGDGTLAVISTHTELVSELGRTDNVTSTVANSRVTYTGTFGTGLGTGAITEAGIFDADLVGTDGGNMLSRSVFPVVNKAIDDYITILWVITVGSCT